MTIGNISGNGPVDRGASSAPRADRRDQPASRRTALDAASISSDGQQAAAALAARVAAAAVEDADRPDQVARAVEKLMSGELDTEQVHRATAERLAESDFLAS